MPGLLDKTAGLILFGLPAVLGIRYSWAQDYWLGAFSLVIIGFYVTLLILSLRGQGGQDRLAILWLFIIGFIAIFLLSGFGIDATGRYLLPLILPITILIAVTIARARLQIVLIGVLLCVNLIGTLNAIAHNPPGITPQFDPVTDIPNTDDQAVIAFLKAHHGSYGYATYWVAYRLDFLSGESITLSPLLPYKYPYSYGGPDRYPAYTAQVEKADHPVLVTANIPEFDDRIAAYLKTSHISYEKERIGIFQVYYNLSGQVTPDDVNSF